MDNLSLREGEHDCTVASSETSVLYLQVPKVYSMFASLQVLSACMLSSLSFTEQV